VQRILSWARTRYGAVALSVAVVVGFLFFFSPGFFRALELKLLDEQFRLRGRRTPAVAVHIVAIDDLSLEKVGRWPWPRTTLARLFEALAAGKPKVVGLDVILSEPEKSQEQRLAGDLLKRYQALGVSGPSAQAFARELQELQERGSPDAVLAAAMEKLPLVQATYFSLERALQPGPAPQTPQGKFGFIRLRGREQRTLFLPAASKITEPILPLIAAATHLGHVNILPDMDGTVRRETLALGFRDQYYPSLALQVARVALSVPVEQMLLDLAGTIHVGPVPIPTDVEGRMLINFAGPEKTFLHHSAADILSGAVPPDTFKDAIILIGATATGIFDMRVTPYAAVFPGVEIHANTVENIVGRRFVERPAWVEIVVFLLILAIPFGLAACLQGLRPLGGGVLALGLILGLFMLAQIIFMAGGIWLPVFYPILAVAATHVPITIHRALTEERQRLFVKRAFQQYVPEKLVGRILDDPSLLKFGGDRKELTILFSDVRAFTTYSERHTPEQVVDILGEYLTKMVDVLFVHDGTLDKFVGDAVMAVFGAPVPQKDHALRACKTAVDMMACLKDLQAKWKQEGKEPFHIGIGINTGEVITGNLGSVQRFDYTVIGDPVNLAARLESLNKEFPQASGIIISKFTYQQVQGSVEARLLGEVTVKGKVKPVKVYELLGVK
jgi:adenylate cyclase